MGEAGTRVGNVGVRLDLLRSRLKPAGYAAWMGGAYGRVCVRVDDELAVDPRRKAKSLSVKGTYDGEKPTFRIGVIPDGFDGFGGTGEMTCSPNGVMEPRRGCWVCMYNDGCATAMTEGIAGADDGDVGDGGLRYSISHISCNGDAVTQKDEKEQLTIPDCFHVCI